MLRYVITFFCRVGGLYLFGGLFASCPVFGLTTDPSLELRFGLRARGVDEPFNQGQLVGTQFDGRLNYPIAPPLSARIHARARIETGAARSFYEDEFGARNELSLVEGLLVFDPASWISLSAGAIDQSFLHTPILVDTYTFAGARQQFRLDVGGVQWELITEQTIAPTPNRSFLRSSESESLPTFFLGRFQATANIGPLSLQPRASLFQFGNLGAQNAQRSRFLGNSVSGIGADNARLVYNFEGYELGAQLLLNEKQRLAFGLEGSLLENTGAPIGENRAYFARLWSQWRVSSLQIKPVLTAFYLEQNSTPAVYARKEWGFGNRKGWDASLALLFPQREIEAMLSYAQSDPVASSPHQGKFQHIQLQVEMSYDAL